MEKQTLKEFLNLTESDSLLDTQEEPITEEDLQKYAYLLQEENEEDDE